jgi:hypothetical protein
VSNDEQLAWEARAGRPAAVAAFAAAVVSFTAGIYLQAALGGIPDADEYLREAAREPSHFIISGVLLAIGSLLVIPVLRYLYRATKHRRPELPPTALYLGILGAVTLAVTQIWRYIEVTNLADGFFPFEPADDAATLSDPDDYAEAVDPERAAEKEIREALPPALQGIGLGGSLALAFSFVMISLNAMRVGLLSRFMGIIGIFVGVLLVIPLPVQIIQLFWFAALGFLFLGKWPGAGRGPAWEIGEPIPWPGAADRHAPDEPLEDEDDEDQAPEPDEPDEPQTPRPASRKRKKKRR